MRIVSGCECKTSEGLLINAESRIKQVCPDESSAMTLYNTRDHGRPCVESADIPRTTQKPEFFHLFTIPSSPQLNTTEMVLSQPKNHSVSVLVRSPEEWRSPRKMMDGLMVKITQTNIKSHWMLSNSCYSMFERDHTQLTHQDTMK